MELLLSITAVLIGLGLLATMVFGSLLLLAVVLSAAFDIYRKLKRGEK